jgi:type I restriction enzyme S subunit
MRNLQKSAQDYTKSNIDIPFNWKIVKLGDVLKVQGGYAFKSSDYVDSGVKLIRITNISFGWTDLTDLSWLPFSYLEKYKDFSLAENDIVIVLTRPIIEGGIKAARIMRDALPALLNQRIARFNIIKKDKINPGFLYYIIFSPNFINYVKQRLGVTNQPNISPRYTMQRYVQRMNQAKEVKIFSDCWEQLEERIQKLRF